MSKLKISSDENKQKNLETVSKVKVSAVGK
jgi:hypothetical protein